MMKHFKSKKVYGILIPTGLLLFGSCSFLALNQPKEKTVVDVNKMELSKKPKSHSSKKPEVKDTLTDKESQASKELKKSKKKEDPANSVFRQYGITTNPLIPSVSSLGDKGDLSNAYTAIKNQLAKEKEKEKPVGPLPDDDASTLPSVKPEIPVVPDVPQTPEPEPIKPVWVGPSLEISEETIVVNQGEQFIATDYFTVIPGTDKQPEIIISTIDTSTPGIQYLSVVVNDQQGYTKQAELRVFVNSRPVIDSQQVKRTIHVGETYNFMDGVTAMDVEDGDLTKQITYQTNLNTNIEGEYQTIYQVRDQYGATISQTVNIKVINDAPVILAEDVTDHQIFTPFDPLKDVRVTDTEDGQIDLTVANVLENNVDVNKEGTYKVILGNVKDKQGKKAEDVAYYVTVTNEAPVLSDEMIQVHVFSTLSKEELFDQLIYSDREDNKDQLVVSVDETTWQSVNFEQPGEYSVSVTVKDTMGKETTKDIAIKIVNDSPVIEGAVNREIFVGDSSFDPLEGITVADTEEPLTTADITISGDYDVNVPGEYKITLSVNDSFTTVTITYLLTVKENTSEETPAAEIE